MYIGSMAVCVHVCDSQWGCTRAKHRGRQGGMGVGCERRLRVQGPSEWGRWRAGRKRRPVMKSLNLIHKAKGATGGPSMGLEKGQSPGWSEWTEGPARGLRCTCSGEQGGHLETRTELVVRKPSTHTCAHTTHTTHTKQSMGIRHHRIMNLKQQQRFSQKTSKKERAERRRALGRQCLMYMNLESLTKTQGDAPSWSP
jgi:hypothetical protein